MNNATPQSGELTTKEKEQNLNLHLLKKLRKNYQGRKSSFLLYLTTLIYSVIYFVHKMSLIIKGYLPILM